MGQVFGKWDADDLTISRIKRGTEVCLKLFKEMGAKAVVLPQSSRNDLLEVESDEFRQFDYDTVRSFQGVAVHGMASVSDRVPNEIGAKGQLINDDRVLIADSSLLPNNIGESPQIPIMTMSYMNAKAWLKVEHDR